jgi:peptidase U49-like protein
MRIIDNTALTTMKSPARLVLDPFHRAIINVAPERQSEFDKLFPDFIIEYLDTHKWILHVDTAARRIQLSSFVIEFLWATAYAHLIFYIDIFQGRSFKTRQEISLRETPRLRAAIDLLKWAVEKLVNQDTTEWPEDLPKPRFRPGFASDEDVADEFALGAAACLIHHEFGHLALQHSGGSTIETERDADAYAWEWILGKDIDLNSPAGKKRLLLLAHAYSVAVIRDIHLGATSLISHPRSIDRVFILFSRWNVPPNHVAVSFAFATFYLHLENSPKPLPPQSEAYNSFAASLDAVLNHISTFPTIQ